MNQVCALLRGAKVAIFAANMLATGHGACQHSGRRRSPGQCCANGGAEDAGARAGAAVACSAFLAALQDRVDHIENAHPSAQLGLLLTPDRPGSQSGHAYCNRQSFREHSKWVPKWLGVHAHSAHHVAMLLAPLSQRSHLSNALNNDLHHLATAAH